MVQQDGSLVAVQGQVVEQSMDSQIITQPQQIATQPQQYIPQPQETVVEEYSFEKKTSGSRFLCGLKRPKWSS